MPTNLRNLTVRAYPSRGWDNRVRGTGLRKTAFFTCNTTYGDYGYIHMLTNISRRNEAIYTIEAVGYNYGNAQDVFCFWGFKPNEIESNQLRVGTRGSGITPDGAYNGGVYISSNEYGGTSRVVLTAYSNTYFYIGFALNVYANTVDEPEPDNEDQIIPDVQITAAEIITTSGLYY